MTRAIPSVMRPCHSGTLLDTAGPDTTSHNQLDVRDLRKRRPERPAPPITVPEGRTRPPAPRKPLTSPDLAHNWPTATVNGPPNRSRTRIRPCIQEHRHRA